MESTNNTKEFKTYEIENLDQICNIVTEDNIELLLLDFKEWLVYYQKTIENIRNKHPELTKNLSNVEIARAKFIWTDDGVNKLTGVSYINTTTGEKKVKIFDESEN